MLGFVFFFFFFSSRRRHTRCSRDWSSDVCSSDLPDRLRARILLWIEEEIRLGNLPPKSGNVLEAVLYRGELPRGDAAAIVGTGDRQARRIVSTLLETHVLTSDSARSPLRLAFPAVLAS